MQKKLIAVAVAGALAAPLALAQTNVTISGRVAAGYESYKQSDTSSLGLSTKNESRVSDQSSRIIFNVNEDLGGGLKAWAQMDMRYSNDLGGIGMTGNTGLGLMSNTWGKFTLGRWDVHYGELDGALGAARAGSLQTLIGNGLMSQVTGITIANGTRTPNIMMWDSPNWNGVTARLAYSTSFAATEGTGLVATAVGGNPGGGDAWTGAVRYNNGPWTAGLSHWDAETENQTNGAPYADQRSTRAWVGYTFPMGLKLGFGWDNSKLDFGLHGVAGSHTTAKRSAWMVPVSYAFGPHKVYLTYARAGKLSGSAVAPGTGGDFKATAWNVGYDYALSKRTSAGVYYTKYRNNDLASYNMFALGANGATPNVVGIDSRQIYFGLAHNF